jgi:hypothetical protein
MFFLIVNQKQRIINKVVSIFNQAMDLKSDEFLESRNGNQKGKLKFI